MDGQAVPTFYDDQADEERSLTSPSVQDELKVIESYFDELDQIEQLCLAQAPEWPRRINRLLGRIIYNEVGTKEVEKRRQEFLRRILASEAITELFDTLLNQCALISRAGPNSLNSQSDQLKLLRLIREFVQLYARRKYVVISLFQTPVFQYYTLGTIKAGIFCAQLVREWESSTYRPWVMHIGIFCFGMIGQTISLRVRVVPRGMRALSRKKMGAFTDIWSKHIFEAPYIDDHITLELPLELHDLGGRGEPLDLEVGLFSSSGDCLDTVRITERTATPEVNSVIKDINVTLTKKEIVVHYDLQLIGSNSSGCYVVIDFLDRYGDLIPDRRLSLFQPALDYESGHEICEPYKLAYKRFIPVANGSDAQLIGELRVSAKSLGLRLFKKEIYLNIILFDSSEAELDQREKIFFTPPTFFIRWISSFLFFIGRRIKWLGTLF